jgi:hypothetical protein
VAERPDRMSALLELVRWQGRGFRADYAVGRGLLDACYSARDVGVPDEFISAALCVLEVASQRIGASSAVVRADFSDLFNLQVEMESSNRKGLDQVRKRLEDIKIEPKDVLLLGDLGMLLGLYQSLGAFRAQAWAVGIPGLSNTVKDSVTEQSVMALPFEVRFGWLGALEDRLDVQSRLMQVGDAAWRVPSRELLVVLLAARVGEPQVNPSSGSWAHLAVALKAMRDEFWVDEALRLAGELQLAERVHRGLAIVCNIFPELGSIIPSSSLDIPVWERVALRVAATKLLKTATEEHAQQELRSDEG